MTHIMLATKSHRDSYLRQSGQKLAIMRETRQLVGLSANQQHPDDNARNVF